MNAPTAYQAYAETAIHSSDPLELTRVLYRTAIDAIQKAVDAFRTGDVRQRAQQIGRAQQIVAELLSSLNSTNAPELGQQLIRLYEYVLHKLQAGNFEQRAEPLMEAEAVLRTLLEAWDQCEPTNSQLLSGVTAA